MSSIGSRSRSSSRSRQNLDDDQLLNVDSHRNLSSPAVKPNHSLQSLHEPGRFSTEQRNQAGCESQTQSSFNHQSSHDGQQQPTPELRNQPISSNDGFQHSVQSRSDSSSPSRQNLNNDPFINVRSHRNLSPQLNLPDDQSHLRNSRNELGHARRQRDRSNFPRQEARSGYRSRSRSHDRSRSPLSCRSESLSSISSDSDESEDEYAVYFTTLKKYKRKIYKVYKDGGILTVSGCVDEHERYAIVREMGGVQTNVIPNNITAVFDIRLDPEVNHDDFESMLQKWCQEAGKNVHFTFEEKNRFVPSTKLDNSNPYWIAFKKCCDEQNINLDIGIFPGGTDSRYIRDLGIPALGFSPMNNTKILLHDHDEHLNKDVFIRGIQIYEEIIKAISNV